MNLDYVFISYLILKTQILFSPPSLFHILSILSKYYYIL